MKQIRRGVFETNSSSTHSVSIYSEKEYKEMDKNSGDYYWDGNEDTMIHIDAVKEMIKEKENLTDREIDDMDESAWEELLESNDIYSEKPGSEYLETDITRYTTESGDKIVIVCQYGHD